MVKGFQPISSQMAQTDVNLWTPKEEWIACMLSEKSYAHPALNQDINKVNQQLFIHYFSVITIWLQVFFVKSKLLLCFVF